MIELSRTVRFCLNDGCAPGPGSIPGSGSAPGMARVDDGGVFGEAVSGTAGPTRGVSGGMSNTFSGWPAMRGLGRYYELDVVCRGEADVVTGYFINIRDIDMAVRDVVLPELGRVVAGVCGGGGVIGGSVSGEAGPTGVSGGGGCSSVGMGWLMGRVLGLLQERLGGVVVSVLLRLTPYYGLEIRSVDMGEVVIYQRYEFSAAHRLHVDELGEEENWRVFGKCNNPSGHGHNYEVEVAVRVGIDGDGGVLDVGRLDEVVNDVVIEKLDHKHLNVDVEEFSGVNPTVENIVRVIYEMLDGEVLAGIGGELEEVGVWETGKTVCRYRGS